MGDSPNALGSTVLGEQRHFDQIFCVCMLVCSYFINKADMVTMATRHQKLYSSKFDDASCSDFENIGRTET